MNPLERTIERHRTRTLHHHGDAFLRNLNKLTRRFKLVRYVSFTEEELVENDRIWNEANPAPRKG